MRAPSATRLRVAYDELPTQLSSSDAVEVAYPEEIARALAALTRRLPVLFECDKELTPYLFRTLRERLKAQGRRVLYLDGRPSPPPPGAPPQPEMGALPTMTRQLREAVRGAVDERIVVLPHLDLLTASAGEGLTADAREVIALVYENPEALWLGFKDPSFHIPDVISDLFPCRIAILGVARERLAHLVTQREAKKLSRETFEPYRLYKYVSGVHAVRLRRLLSAVEGIDHPSDAGPAFAQLRQATLVGEASVPDIDLDKDIGGYAAVKARLKADILDVLRVKEAAEDGQRVQAIEDLVPRGMIFWGPPGTGKTLFAKAMASALGAAVFVVSGPELKSKWVGESEENLRRVFLQARQSAPSVIVFDEIDSFAGARGSYDGTGVEHSMVNQLLTEMDGFRKNEMVFVVGTTNFVESLDPALLRPGRFEMRIHVPYPDAEDRRAILRVHDAKLGLELTTQALEHAVRRTGSIVEGGTTRYSGDHLQALCRAMARERLRRDRPLQTDVADVELALASGVDRPKLTPAEERVVATHEAGHAVVALHCKYAPPIERISIQGDIGGSLGAVSFADPAHRYVVTRAQLLDRMCVLFGGREAEQLMEADLSVGSEHDVAHATAIAHALIEQFGMGPEEVGVRRLLDAREDVRAMGTALQAHVDDAVRDVLKTERARAREILLAHRGEVESLRDLLLERKALDAGVLASLRGGPDA
jgi:cell division protease FtsH